MHKRFDRAVGVLLLVLALCATGCGGDDGGDAADGTGDGGETPELCVRAEELDEARRAVPTAQPSSQEDLDEAKASILDLIDALQALLEAVPDALRADAEEVLATTDDIEQRISEAEGADVVVEVPGLLAQISEGETGPFARILDEVEATCA